MSVQQCLKVQVLIFVLSLVSESCVGRENVKNLKIKRDIPTSSDCSGCGVDGQVCKCELRIRHAMTSMIRINNESYLIRPKGNGNGMLQLVGKTNGAIRTNRDLTEDEARRVLTTDGWNPELVITINDKFPGPTIVANEGQNMEITVINLMHTDSLTIHWHGLHQRGTPWMDGVHGITQCPIGPDQTFIYRFNATPHGTNLYHSHIGDQRSMGLYGALIVKKTTEQDQYAGLEEFIVTLQDWNHDMDPETAYYTMISEQFKFDENTVIDTTSSYDGGQFSRFVFQSGLVNGKGRYYSDASTHNGAPLERFEVVNGRNYRFRVISAATLYPFRVHVEGHALQLVASDGFDMAIPSTVQSFVVHPGERFDFILQAQNSANKKEYMLVAETLEVNLNNAYHAAEAIISFSDHSATPNDSPPKAPSETCTSSDKCVVFNCPFPIYPISTNRDCLDFNSANTSDALANVDSIQGTPDREIFVNFGFPGTQGNTPGSANGRQFVFPPSPILTQRENIELQCDDQCQDANDICSCTYIEEISNGQLIQLVMTNIGNGSGWSHPVHIHGHALYVLKMAFGQYDASTGRILVDNADVRCTDNNNFCTSASWTDSSWANGNIPGLSFDRPFAQKDTIIIPTGGYVVARFRANNPGAWFLHCHIDLHNTNGMGLVVLEATDNLPTPPRAFPTCGNFLYGGSGGQSDNPGVQDADCTGCEIDGQVCKCTLRIRHTMTSMIRIDNESYLVRPKINENGKLQLIGKPTGAIKTSRDLTEGEKTRVLTTDGWNPELVITINDKFPGPTIVANEGQNMEITVINLMHTDSLTIHWHGLHQRGTPWMDGVHGITQCPVGPDQTFIYRFNATPHGTNLYHSHIGDQRSMGLYGALIVKKTTGQDPYAGLEEFIVTLQDWNHDMDPETAYYTMISEQFKFDENTVIDTTSSYDGGQFSRFVFQSGLVNGKGRYYSDASTHNGAPLERFEVVNGRNYRFRVISAATLYPFRVHVEGHALQLVASDGFDMAIPSIVQSFVVHPGERFDFILQAQNSANKKEYMLVAETLEVNLNNAYHAAEAIISFSDHSATPNDSPSKAPSETCTSSATCVVFNCPFPMYPTSENRQCLDFNNATNNDTLEDLKNIQGTPDREIFVNFGFPGTPGNTPGSANGRQFVFPPSPILTQLENVDSRCDDNCRDPNNICSCTYMEEISSGQLIQLVMTNIGNGSGWSHPVHIHGHAMYVLKMAYGRYDASTGRILDDNEDVRCTDSSNYCTSASWTDSSWANGNVPGLSFNRRFPQKDTVIIPTGGYVVARFRADNPGAWFLHCHIDLHNTNGMGLVVLESRDNLPLPPKSFPSCGNFLYAASGGEPSVGGSPGGEPSGGGSPGGEPSGASSSNRGLQLQIMITILLLDKVLCD